jgi:GT2 family glycosyltransferase
MKKSDTLPTSRLPLITISIINHGTAREIEQLLESLFNHEQRDNFQILITDNLGNDIPDTGYENCTVLRNEEPKGFAHNQNAAFRHARGEYFCVLNPDIVFVQSVFDRLVERITFGQADIVAPLVVDSQGLFQDSFRDLPTPSELIRRRIGRKTHQVQLAKDSETIHPDWMAGMLLLMKAATFEQLGGFDESYYLYMEDVDICTRARLQGLSLVVDAGAKVQHDAHRSSKQSLKYLLWHLQSAWRFFRSPVYKNARKIKR